MSLFSDVQLSFIFIYLIIIFAFLAHFSIDEPKYMGTVVSTIEPISIKDLQQDEIFEKTLFVRFFSKDTRDFEVQVGTLIVTSCLTLYMTMSSISRSHTRSK